MVEDMNPEEIAAQIRKHLEEVNRLMFIGSVEHNMSFTLEFPKVWSEAEKRLYPFIKSDISIFRKL